MWWNSQTNVSAGGWLLEWPQADYGFKTIRYHLAAAVIQVVGKQEGGFAKSFGA
jgi:hypothetical protein